MSYKKIIIMKEEEVDGENISKIMIKLLLRKMKEMIERGNIYIEKKKIYKVKRGKY